MWASSHGNCGTGGDGDEFVTPDAAVYWKSLFWLSSFISQKQGKKIVRLLPSVFCIHVRQYVEDKLRTYVDRYESSFRGWETLGAHGEHRPGMTWQILYIQMCTVRISYEIGQVCPSREVTGDTATPRLGWLRLYRHPADVGLNRRTLNIARVDLWKKVNIGIWFMKEGIFCLMDNVISLASGLTRERGHASPQIVNS